MVDSLQRGGKYTAAESPDSDVREWAKLAAGLERTRLSNGDRVQRIPGFSSGRMGFALSIFNAGWDDQRMGATDEPKSGRYSAAAESANGRSVYWLGNHEQDFEKCSVRG